MPLETKKPHQLLIKVTHLRNKKTGEIRTRVDGVDKINYEFESESLADFKYGLDSEFTNQAKEEQLM